MGRYLEQRGLSWSFTIDVPKALQPVVGKRRIKEALGTRDRSEARKKALIMAGQWLEHFDKLKKAEGLHPAPDTAEGQARWWREWVEASAIDEEFMERHSLLQEEIDRRLEAALQRQGLNPDQLEHLNAPDLSVFIKRAQNVGVLIADHIDGFLSSAPRAEQTNVEYRAAFAILLPRHSDAVTVTRKDASAFIDKYIKPGRKSATVNKIIGAYRGLWKYLIKRGELPTSENPWSEQSVAQKRAGDAEERRPFTEAEGASYLNLIRAKFGDGHDYTAVAELLAVTGLRVEEACQLKVGGVSIKDGVAWVSIQKGKTKAARRTIPVVAPVVVAQLATRLTDDAGAWVFRELKSLANSRSHYIKKALSPLLRKVSKDPALVPNHSWRHRAQTLMERGGIELSTAEWFIGHVRAGEGMGRYSKGPGEAQLIAAARCIPLPSVEA